MSRFASRSCLTALVTLLIASPVMAQVSGPYDEWYEALRNLAPDPARGARVENLQIQRDAATFYLTSGTLHLAPAVGERTYAAIFSGEGRFEMTAPDPVEQDQLYRAFESAAVIQPIEGAVFLFTDFLLSELESEITFGPLEAPSTGERDAREVRDYFTDGDGWVMRSTLLPLINGAFGYFRAHVWEDRGDPLIFVVDPHSAEEVSLYERAGRAKASDNIAQFHKASDYETGRSVPEEGLDLIRIAEYDIETTIEDDFDLIGRATASVTRIQRSYDWIPFSLYSELEVDSVRWGDGTPADFVRPRESQDLWIDFGSAPAEETELIFYYNGEMFDRPRGLWVVLGTHTTWYPVYKSGRLAQYRTTFHAPEDYVVVSVGEQVSMTHDEEEEMRTTVFETAPVRMLTFNIGEFDEFLSEEPGAPSLRVLVNEGAHRRLGAMVADAGGILFASRDMPEAVSLDLRNSFRFYEEVYGATQLRDFVASEIPYSHGEAYPGLVMLAWTTFQTTNSRGFDEMFRAHEVAHQWWGIDVRPATYRDWWIAEGFSEFSGWWYAARARGSVDMYLRRLRETREEIFERRDEAGPIIIGRRTATTDFPGDYQTTVYNKGAWVLHMLRVMLTDPDTGNDDLFNEVMKTFYATHRGGMASTASFQRTAEEVVGADLGWFFDQWVRGTALPTYRFSHDYEDLPDGRVQATIRVRQEGVPGDFRMIVPLLVDFGDEGSALLQINVEGPETTMQLPILPRVPDRMELNPNESVLAEVRTEGWRN